MPARKPHRIVEAAKADMQADLDKRKSPGPMQRFRRAAPNPSAAFAKFATARWRWWTDVSKDVTVQDILAVFDAKADGRSVECRNRCARERGC
jgi:hypothetical protein